MESQPIHFWVASTPNHTLKTFTVPWETWYGNLMLPANQVNVESRRYRAIVGIVLYSKSLRTEFCYNMKRHSNHGETIDGSPVNASSSRNLAEGETWLHLCCRAVFELGPFHTPDTVPVASTGEG